MKYSEIKFNDYDKFLFLKINDLYYRFTIFAKRDNADIFLDDENDILKNAPKIRRMDKILERVYIGIKEW